MNTTPTGHAGQTGLADLFADREAAAARPPDINPYVTWHVRHGRAPAEGA